MIGLRTLSRVDLKRKKIVKGVYATQSGNNDRSNWKYKCKVHETNDHDYWDNTCQSIFKKNGNTGENQGRIEKAVKDGKSNKKGKNDK